MRIILARLKGKEIQQVAREMRVSVVSVSKWRQRFSLWGPRGLRDEPRSGKPVRHGAAFRKLVLATLEEPPPPGMSHWDGPAVAEKLDASVHAVWPSCAAKESTCKGGVVGALVPTKSLLPKPLT